MILHFEGLRHILLLTAYAWTSDTMCGKIDSTFLGIISITVRSSTNFYHCAWRGKQWMWREKKHWSHNGKTIFFCESISFFLELFLNSNRAYFAWFTGIKISLGMSGGHWKNQIFQKLGASHSWFARSSVRSPYVPCGLITMGNA